VIGANYCGKGEVVPLYSKAFDLFAGDGFKTAARSHEDELLESVWPGQMLEQANLTVNFSGGGPTKYYDIPPQANFRYAIRWTADGKAITYRDCGKDYGGKPIEGGPPQQVTGTTG